MTGQTQKRSNPGRGACRVGDRGGQDGSGHGGPAFGLSTGVEESHELGGCSGRAAPSSRGSTGTTEVG